MPTKNISLPEDLDQYVDAKVASGEYAHASEVIRDGLRLLMREEATKLEWLRTAIAKGAEDFERGDFVLATPKLLDDIVTRAAARLRARGVDVAD